MAMFVLGASGEHLGFRIPAVLALWALFMADLLLGRLANKRLGMVGGRSFRTLSSRLSRHHWWLIGAATAAIGYLSLFRLYQSRTANFVNFTPTTFDLDPTLKAASRPSWDFSHTPILLVSAFFPLPTSKHSDEEYAVWLQLFLSRITTPLVIYTTVAFSPTISRLRGNLPTIINTDFSTPFDVPPMRGLETKYADQHARLDPEKFRHNPSLYATWNAKAWLVEDAARRYATGNTTEWFFWSDAGSVRQSHTFQNWPDLARIEDLWEKGSREGGTAVQDLLFMQIWDPPPATRQWRLWETKEDGTVDLGTSGMMSEGSFFGGKLPAIKWWASTFYELHDYYLSRDIFVGKDQNLFNTIMFIHPARILTVWPRDPLKRLDPPPPLRNALDPQPNGPPEGQYVPTRKCTWAAWYYFWYWLASDHERREMRQLMVREYDLLPFSDRAKVWFKYDLFRRPAHGECRITKAWTFRGVLKEALGT